MKKLLLFILWLPLWTQGQIFTHPLLNLRSHSYTDSTQKNLIVEAEGAFDINATSVSNRYYFDYATNDFFNDEIKAEGQRKLQSIGNRVGYYWQQGLFVSYEMKHKKTHSWDGFYLHLKSRSQLGLTFTEEAYKLLMFGNVDFVGQTLNITGNNLKRVYYQTAELGYYRNFFTGPKHLANIIGGSLAFVKGSTLMDINIQNGSVYTSTIGDSLHIAAEGSINYHPGYASISTFAGFGAAINLFYIKQLSPGSWLRFAANDIGFVRWKSSAMNSYSFNQSIAFTGVNVDFAESNLNPDQFTNIIDSLKDKVTGSKISKKLTTALPAHLYLLYSTTLTSRLSVIAGCEYYFNSLMLPSIDLLAKYRFSDGFSGGLGVNLLGYGHYGIIANADVRIGNYLMLGIGTQHLEVIASAKQTTGQGLFARLLYRLNSKGYI